MQEELKILLKKVMIIVLPVVVLLGTAMLVSGNGLSLGGSSTGSQAAQGTGCNHPHP